MRRIYKNISTIAAMVLALGTAANAADMPRFPSALPPLETPPLLVDEFSSGWYLRGDVGYRFNNEVDKVERLGGTPTPFDDALTRSWVIGGGIGYKWGWFRSDLTVDYGSKSRYDSDSPLLTNDFHAKIDNATALLNFYGDLGTWWGFTPYVGAGLGGAWVQVSDFRVESSSGGEHPMRQDNWNFAWGYMAGVSYSLTSNYHIDIGYRHVNLGDVITGVDRSGNKLKFKDMSSDEVRIGFRLTLD